MPSWFTGFAWITEVIEKLLSKPSLTSQRQFCSSASRAISWDYWKVCYSKEKYVVHMQHSYSWTCICLSVLLCNEFRDWLYNSFKLCCRTNSTVKTSMKPQNINHSHVHHQSYFRWWDLVKTFHVFHYIKQQLRINFRSFYSKIIHCHLITLLLLINI